MTNEIELLWKRRSCYTCKHLQRCLEKQQRARANAPQHVADRQLQTETQLLDAIAELCDEYEEYKEKGAEPK